MKIKHIIRAILSLLAELLLCACQDSLYAEEDLLPPTRPGPVLPSADQPFTYRTGGDTRAHIFERTGRTLYEYEGALYYFPGMGRIPYRYNPETNGQLPFCSDPLCTHERYTSCRYTDLGNTHVIAGEQVLIRRESDSFVQRPASAVAIDLKDFSVQTLREISGTVSTFGGDVIADQTYFYLNMIYNEQTDKSDFALCRMDLATKKSEILATWPSGEHLTPLFAREDMLYYRDPLDQMILCAPIQDPLKTTPVAQLFDIWYADLAESCYYSLDRQSGTVYRSDSPQMAEVVFHVEGMDYFYLTDQHIYYRRVHGQAEEMTFYGETAYHDLHEYYRCDRDGSNPTLIYREEYELGSYTYFLKDFIVIGNYLYAPWRMQMFDGEINDGKSSDKTINSSLVRIDLESGEWYYIVNE